MVLPIGALVLMSTLFLLARDIDPSDALPFAELDLTERARDLQLTEPRVSGRSLDGTAFRLVADTARPDPRNARRLTIDGLRLDLDGAGGDMARITATTGVIDTAGRTLSLRGDVRIATGTGLVVTTGRLDGNLRRLRLTAPGAVAARGPFGDVEAGGMVLQDGTGGARLRFTGGVDLLYVPPLP
ncbi:LPS export ABC transporter periplasmic protein LptC [Jannaschia sp. LMIT008]|uniref:LPS export ABC transporter periplasmic protein LptC n=1 Tax=Jannaschia maritima TaxID=3032585 RepID=UPI0028120741|nr:LPS export ABC transporter periplasmic protein LptC [Jannaschia sp. LMIT008]